MLKKTVQASFSDVSLPLHLLKTEVLQTFDQFLLFNSNQQITGSRIIFINWRYALVLLIEKQKNRYVDDIEQTFN